MSFMKFRGFAISLLAAITIGMSFQSTSFSFQSISYALDEGPPYQQQDYVIGAEDVLEVLVWKNADLSRQVNVLPDGMITLPLIGEIKAGGLTTETLRKTIVDRIKVYQENAVVSVIVKEINSYKIYVLGEVARPGTYTLKTRTTLLQAIALVGGFTQFASKDNISILREKTAKGRRTEKLTFSLKEIVKDGSPEKNPVLLAGDTIFVP